MHAKLKSQPFSFQKTFLLTLLVVFFAVALFSFLSPTGHSIFSFLFSDADSIATTPIIAHNDDSEPLIPTHYLIFTVPAPSSQGTSLYQEKTITVATMAVDARRHLSSSTSFPNGMFDLCTLWNNDYAELRNPEFEKHDVLELIIDELALLRPQLASFCAEPGQGPLDNDCENAAAPACNAKCPDKIIEGKPYPRFCVPFQPGPHCFCPQSEGAQACAGAQQQTCSTIACASKRIRTPKCHVDVKIYCMWADKPSQKCKCVIDPT